MRGSNKENSELLTYFLENTFFKAWQEPHDPKWGNYKNLELMVHNKCNLKCKYCYMQKFGDQYFPAGTQSLSKILDNTDVMIDWLYENNYEPCVEIFAGDSLTDPTCRKMTHKFLDAALAGRRACSSILFPTNMAWVASDKRTKDVYALLEKAEYAGVGMHISASVDGKYMEENRPYKSARGGYTDEFYDKMFTFMARTGSGAHPMVYSNNIEKWIDNFSWWQTKYAEYGIPWQNLYLLEVRNAEWTLEQTKHYMEFIKFLVRWLYLKYDRDPERTVDALLSEHRGFNILMIPFGRIGRGMPCSIQSCLCVRMGDLVITPCHRTSYKHMESGQFMVEDNKITGIEAKNIELFFSIQAADNEMFPYCERCSINGMCKGGCLGAQFETTGNLFAPIPTVCRLAHGKVIAIKEVMQELGMWLPFIRRFPREYVLAFKEMEDINELETSS